MSEDREVTDIVDDLLGGEVPDAYPDECQNCGAVADPFWIPENWTPADGAGICTECGDPFGDPVTD